MQLSVDGHGCDPRHAVRTGEWGSMTTSVRGFGGQQQSFGPVSGEGVDVPCSAGERAG